MKCPLNSRYTRERVAYGSLPSIASLAAQTRKKNCGPFALLGAALCISIYHNPRKTFL